MSFPPATEMFQFAGFASALPPITLKAWGCPIRRSSDQRVLPPPRSLSQGATSFIASRCQGIHQMPFSSLESPRSTIRKHTNARPAHVRGPRTSGSRPEDHLLAITRSLRIRRQGTDARCQERQLALRPSDPPLPPATKQTHKGDPPPIAPGNGPPSSSSRLQRSVPDIGCPMSGRLPDPSVIVFRHSNNQTNKPAAPPTSDIRHLISGGAGRDRTDDLLVANQALSRLSYGPRGRRSDVR